MAKLTSLIARILEVLNIVGIVLDSAIKVIGTVTKALNWSLGEKILAWIEDKSVAKWIDRVADFLLRFKG